MASSSRPKPVARGDKSNSGAKSPESYQSLKRRNDAAEILQSYERLSWFSMQRCESLTQTRLHFQNVVAGFTEDDEAALVDWPEDLSPRGDAAKREKGKERVSDVGAGGSTAAVASGSGSASVKKKRKSDGRVVS